MKLKPRLAAVASLVPSASVVADIGTDHAFLPVYLVQDKACPKVIAVEKSELNSRLAQETVNLFNVNHKVEVRVGDGLLALDEKDGVEIVVIAGLGGKTVCRMLIAAAGRLGSYKRLVLQPMGDAALVRRWLAGHGFRFVREKLVQEKDHYYEVIAAEKGHQAVDEPIFLEIGPMLLKDRDPLLVPWLRHKLEHYEKAMKGLLRSRNGKEDPRWRYFNFQYDRLKGYWKMFAAGNDLVSFIDEFAPQERALPGDATGLQWGDLSRELPVLLLALDFSEAVLEEALRIGAPLVFSHHPFLYRPLSRIDLNDKGAALVAQSLKEGISLYSAHTNLDVAPRGVSHALGELLGLEKMQPLLSMGTEELEKLVVFVPEGYEDRVRDALAEAGAGWIGNYSHCTYQLLGTGTFMPREGTSPFIGTQGALEKVSEYRLETILFRRDRKRVLQALFAAHPYEEVAYDLYPLSNEGQAWGLGTIGQLPEKVTLNELAGRCHKLLQPGVLKILGDPKMKIDKVAVMGGSGSEYVGHALQKRAQVFISGDIKFHDAQKAASAGLALIDAGHDATERPVLPVLESYLKERIAAAGFATEVIISRGTGSLWRTFDKG